MAPASGLSAFPITPADAEGRVDAAALRRLVARPAAAGVDSIGLLGSTGIYMYLSRQERRRAVEAAVEEVAGRCPIIAGVGALRTDEAIRLAQDAKATGAAAGLLSAASYTPLTEDEVFEHFSAVARESRLPLIVYDNPGTTHFSFPPRLVGRLAGLPGIVAIKNPGWKAEDAPRLLAGQRALAGDGFSIGCSGDWTAAETMIAGADTWYSVLAGIFPGVCRDIVLAARRGDAAEARRLDAALAPLWELFRRHSSLRVVYALAGLVGLCHAAPPRPILPLPPAARDEVAAALARLAPEMTR